MLTTIAIAFSMSADAFAASLAKGAALKRVNLREALRTGMIFGVIETLTPLLGWAAGLAASRFVAAIDHWIAFALLAGIGVHMIYCGLFAREEEQEERPKQHSFLVLCATAVGTSIDALAVGVTLALIGADIVVTALAIGFTTFMMTSLGVLIGRRIGARLGKSAEALGGVLLIGIGVTILGEHLGWFGDIAQQMGLLG